MANKRIPELRPIEELNQADLFPISDVSAHETKKVSLNDLSSYLLNVGTITASLHGTSSWASNTVSSAFATTATTATNATNATRATSAISASWASSSLSASYIATSSRAITASYALTGGTVGSGTTLVTGALYPITTSWALSSSRASTSSYVSMPYNNSYLSPFALSLGGNAAYIVADGSATFADGNVVITADGYITANRVTSSLYGTSSWANRATSASYATTSSHALNTITASYALATGVAATTMKDYGIALATSSLRSASISSVTLTSDTLTECNTSIECWGTANVQYTGSQVASETIELIALNRWSGVTSSLDKTPLGLTINIGQSGSFTIPFSLAGQASLTPDSYVYYITTSISTSLNTLRTPRFNTVTTADSVTYGSGETMQLKTYISTDNITVYSASVGPMVHSASAFLAAGSASGIRYLDASSVNGTISYVWTLPVLTEFVASSNPSLTDIGGMPPSIVTMSLIGTEITELAPLTYTTASILICNTNLLTALPSLPPSMSYIDCSTNLISSLPSRIPYGVTKFICDANNLVSTNNTSFPAALVSMSFDNNIYLTTWDATIPTATKWLSFDNCQVLSVVSQYIIANNLVDNAQTNGKLYLTTGVDLTTDPANSSSLATKRNALISAGWTVTI